MLVRAGVDLPVPFAAAIPVETQRGRIVSKLPIDGAQDGSGDLLDHFTRVQVDGGRNQADDVGVTALRSSTPSVTNTKRSPGSSATGCTR